VVGVATELARQEQLHVVEESCLVRGADHGVRPDSLDREVLHPRALGQSPKPRITDDRPDLRGRVVVGDVDHRMKQGAAGGIETLMLAVEHAQVGDEQHRLDHARGHEAPMQVRTV
jgi:hypothetical protein